MSGASPIAESDGSPASGPRGGGVALIAGGKLLIVDGDGKRREIISDFVQDMMDRAERRKARHGWKDNSVGWNTSAVPPEVASLSLATARQDGQRMCDFVAVVPVDAERMLYALRTSSFGGLFEYNLAQREERRLAHKAEFRISEIDAHPGDGRLIASVTYEDGTSNLATMRSDGGRMRAITEGDSLDQAPRWVHGSDATIVYQSAGIARDVHGFIAEISPFRIEQLDLDRGEHEVLLESDDHDYLMPTQLADGSLLCVRRPFETLYTAPTAWAVAKDFLLFPVRLLAAIFWFLNSFSMLFARKPLTTANGPRREGANARQLMLYGRVIEAQQRGRGKRDGARPPVVPSSWELIRVGADGDEVVIATGVGHYVSSADGSIVMTDGHRVWRRDAEGQETELAREKLVERVAPVLA